MIPALVLVRKLDLMSCHPSQTLGIENIDPMKLLVDLPVLPVLVTLPLQDNLGEVNRLEAVDLAVEDLEHPELTHLEEVHPLEAVVSATDLLLEAETVTLIPSQTL